MLREEFINYLKATYGNLEIEKELYRIEHMEGDINVVLENSRVVICKDYHEMRIKRKCGKEILLHFCVYGIGTKCNITSEDYEFQSYEKFEYIIL